MRNKTSILHKVGKFLLIVSFVLQLLLLAVQYTGFFATLARSSGSLSWLTSFKDTIGVAAYIGWGSCATQFFLIRLFTMQQRGESSTRNSYLLLCVASCIYHHWYLIRALFKGYSFGFGDIASLVFGLGLTLMILVAIMLNHRLLGLICAIIALAQAGWDIYALSSLYRLMSAAPVTIILICELLYDLGLCFCCAGIKAMRPAANSMATPPETVEEKA